MERTGISHFEICLGIFLIFMLVFGAYFIDTYVRDSYTQYSKLQLEYLVYQYETEKRINKLKRIIDFQEQEINKLKGLE